MSIQPSKKEAGQTAPREEARLGEPAASGGDVALVNMPFGHSKYSSIQLGTLSALLKAHGIASRSHYLNLYFAQRIGFPLYDVLCESQLLIGEWLFSRLLFPEHRKRAEYPRDFKPIIEEICRKGGCASSY